MRNILNSLKIPILTAVSTFVVLIIPLPFYAQVMCDPQMFRLNKIAGTVVSNGPKGFEPIAKTKIELLRPGRLGENDILVASTASDDNGLFSLPGIKPGRYRLEVSKSNSGFLRFYAVTIVAKKVTRERQRKLRIRLGVSPLENEGCGDAVLIDN